MRFEYINGHLVEFIDEHNAIVWSTVKDNPFHVVSDENVLDLVMFLLGVSDAHEYMSRNMEDTQEIELKFTS